jgi:serine/threonine-protein kinase
MSAAIPTWEGLELAGGRYRITSRLVGGGMAEVYRAWDKNLQTDVIIKVPLEELLRNSTFAARFSREVRSLVRFAHPHIVKVVDVGEHQGVPFAVMQYLAGGSLRNRQIGPGGQVQPLAPAHLTGWLGGIAEALDFIHSQHYIHRDVKPGNILFDSHGNAYLSDFGVIKAIAGEGSEELSANLTQRGMVLGTLQYMAPEIFRGQKYDGRADQYALGVTIYEVLSGRWPFSGKSPAEVMQQRMKHTPTALHNLLSALPPAISQAVAKALAKEPAERFADCKSLARAVLDALRAPAATPVAASGKPASRLLEATAVAPAAKKPTLYLACPMCQEMLSVAASDAGKRLACPTCRADLGVSADGRRLTGVGKSNQPAPAPQHEAPAPMTFGLPVNTEAVEQVQTPMTFGLTVEDSSAPLAGPRPPAPAGWPPQRPEPAWPAAPPPMPQPQFPTGWDTQPAVSGRGWIIFLLIMLALLLLGGLAAGTYFTIRYLQEEPEQKTSVEDAWPKWRWDVRQRSFELGALQPK